MIRSNFSLSLKFAKSAVMTLASKQLLFALKLEISLFSSKRSSMLRSIFLKSRLIKSPSIPHPAPTSKTLPEISPKLAQIKS